MKIPQTLCLNQWLLISKGSFPFSALRGVLPWGSERAWPTGLCGLALEPFLLPIGVHRAIELLRSFLGMGFQIVKGLEVDII